MLNKKDFISIKGLTTEEINEIFVLAEKFKANGLGGEPLKKKTLALIFQKPSNRTRVSFEVGMNQLGGQAVYLRPDELKLGIRESVSDIAKVLSRYVDGIVARTFKHQDIVDLSKDSSIPVVNGLSDLLHPCQALSDLFTIKEKFKGLGSVKLAFVGDGNNVLNSLMYGAAVTGMKMSAANPKGYGPKKEITADVKNLCRETGGRVSFYDKPENAVEGADIVYTDVWISMGQEGERKERLRAFKGFQVNSKLLAKAKKGCVIMHCMPAHRGEEITDEVLDSPNSIVLDQAENRLHVQKAILYLLMAAKNIKH